MGNLTYYRDDGPLVRLLAGAVRRVPAPALPLMVAGTVVLLVVMGVDGGDPGVATLVGFAVFMTLASAASVASTELGISWLVPPITRLAEYGFVVWLGWAAGPTATGVVYGLLAAVAFHHYDVVYRLRHQKAAPPRWVFLSGGGWDGRMTVLLIAAVAGLLSPVAGGLAVWCALLYVSESAWSWASLARAEQTSAAEEKAA